MKYKISALLSLKGRAERYIGTPSKGVRLFLYCVAHPNGGGAFYLLLTPLVIYKGAGLYCGALQMHTKFLIRAYDPILL